MTKEVLGGPQVAADTSGVIHNVVVDDVEAVALARRYLAHFPLNRWEPPPRRDGPDAGRRRVVAWITTGIRGYQLTHDRRLDASTREAARALIDACEHLGVLLWPDAETA